MDSLFIFIEKKDLEKIIRNFHDLCVLYKIQKEDWKYFRDLFELEKNKLYFSKNLLKVFSEKKTIIENQEVLLNILSSYNLIFSKDNIKSENYVNILFFLQKLIDFLVNNINFILNYDPSYKLVRDKIPEILKEKSRRDFNTKLIKNKEEFMQKLKEKLVEEVVEFLNSESLEEIVDILEVIEAILKIYNIDWKSIFEMKEKKKQERGGFSKRILLKIG